MFEFTDNFCDSKKECKEDVLYALMYDHLMTSGQTEKAKDFKKLMTNDYCKLNVDDCLALRVEKLQTKNQYKDEYEQINSKSGRKVLQPPFALDQKEKSYVPPSARWTLIGDENVNLYQTPAKLQRKVVSQSARGSDFEPTDILEDFHAALPELPKPNCKGVKWNYVDALAKTLEEMDDDIVKGLQKANVDVSDQNIVFSVTVKDGADGMGDVSRHTEMSDRYLPDKAFRFSFAIVLITANVNDQVIEVYRETLPSSCRVNRPLLVAIADENYKSSCNVCMSTIENERYFMKNKILKVHIPLSIPYYHNERYGSKLP